MKPVKEKNREEVIGQAFEGTLVRYWLPDEQQKLKASHRSAHWLVTKLQGTAALSRIIARVHPTHVAKVFSRLQDNTILWQLLLSSFLSCYITSNPPTDMNPTVRLGLCKSRYLNACCIFIICALFSASLMNHTASGARRFPHLTPLDSAPLPAQISIG